MEYGADQFGDGIDYYRSGRESRWAVAATFATVGQWHVAKGILGRHGIAGLMRSTPDQDGGHDLLVLGTELEWARELLASSGESETMTHGFPIDPDSTLAEINPKGLAMGETVPPPFAMASLPVESDDLTTEQQRQYEVTIWFLWALLAIVIGLILLGFIL